MIDTMKPPWGRHMVCPFCRYRVPGAFMRALRAGGVLEPETVRSVPLLVTQIADDLIVHALNNSGPRSVDLGAANLIAVMMTEGTGLGFFDYPQQREHFLASRVHEFAACAACLDGVPYPEGFGPDPEPPETPRDP